MAPVSTQGQAQELSIDILTHELRDGSRGRLDGIRDGISKAKRIAAIDFGSALIGAGGAVAGAVAERLLDIFSREVTEPKLEVRFQDKIEPYCWVQEIKSEKEQAHFGTKDLAYFVRVRIFNTGKSTAAHAIGEIDRVVNLSDQKEIGKFDSIQAQWASGLTGNTKDGNLATEVYIRRGRHRTLGICYNTKDGKGKFNLDIARGAQHLGQRTRGFTGAHYAIEFTVSGEGFEAVTWTAEVNQDVTKELRDALSVKVLSGTIEQNFKI